MTNSYRFDEVSARQLEILYSVPKLIARRQKTLDLLNLIQGRFASRTKPMYTSKLEAEQYST